MKVPASGDHQRVAIGRRLGDIFGADDVGATAFVFDDDGLPPRLGEPLPKARAVTSVTPPGAAVTTMVIGRCGYDADCAAAGPHSDTSASSAPNPVFIGRPRPDPLGRDPTTRRSRRLRAFMTPILRVGVPSCRGGRTNGRSVTGRRSRGSTARCRIFFRPWFCCVRSAGRLCRRRRGLPSTATGGRIRCAPIAWHGAGGKSEAPDGWTWRLGGGAIAACRRRFARRPRRIVSALMHAVRVFAVCAGSRVSFGWHLDLWECRSQ